MEYMAAFGGPGTCSAGDQALFVSETFFTVTTIYLEALYI